MARKTVAAVQGVALLVAASGLLPYAAGAAVVGCALASLVWSFGRDVLWLWSVRGGARVATPAEVVVEPVAELVAGG
jgi:hypothetical protein